MSTDPEHRTCIERRRTVLRTLKGMVDEVEANRLLLLAIAESRPELGLEIANKTTILENYVSSITLALDSMQESCCTCPRRQILKRHCEELEDRCRELEDRYLKLEQIPQAAAEAAADVVDDEDTAEEVANAVEESVKYLVM